MWVSKRKKLTKLYKEDTNKKKKKLEEEKSVTKQDDDNHEFQDDIVCFKVPRLWEQE